MFIAKFINLANFIKLANKYEIEVKGVYPCVGELHYDLSNVTDLNELPNPSGIWLYYHDNYLAWFKVTPQGVNYSVGYLDLLIEGVPPLKRADFHSFIKALKEYHV